MLSPDALQTVDAADQRRALGESLAGHVAIVNEGLDPHERLQFAVVVADEWDVENDFLTPTLKIKRNVIDSAYGPYLDDWYAQGEALIWQHGKHDRSTNDDARAE